MTVRIAPSHPAGTVPAPPSKSMAHRLLLAAGLSKGTSRICSVAESGDVLATLDCLGAIGASVSVEGGTAVVRGCDPKERTEPCTLPCRESGSTLRFFLPLCLLSDAPAVLTGTEKLFSRPLSVYETLCRETGLTFERTASAVTVRGPLPAGDYTLRGDVSSQFVTGLLYALSLAEGESTLRLLPPVESRPYIDMTLAALREFGVGAAWTDETTLRAAGGQTFLPHAVTVEGDWSNAAFLLGLNLLGGNVTVTGLREGSLQGDRVCRPYFEALQSGTPTLSLRDCPDLGPVLFALAAANGGAVFTDVRRLREKESDRIGAMRRELSKFGVRTLETEDTLTVYPGVFAPTEPLFGCGDHRVVMALALLCTRTGGRIAGAEAVRKSFPDFFTVLESLGVKISYELDQQQ